MRLPAPISAMLVVGAIAALSTDWQLVASRDGRVAERICAKTQESCTLAIAAINRGWFAPTLRGDSLRCAPAPGCFSADSLEIRGRR